MRELIAEALVGLLSQRMTGRVNRVNANHLAKEQGIVLGELAQSRDRGDRYFAPMKWEKHYEW